MADNARIIEVAQELVTQAHHYMKVMQNLNKKGGYLAVLNHQRSELVLFAKLGQVSKEKVAQYATLAEEQAWRLSQRGEHVTSFESRNPEALVPQYANGGRVVPELHFEQWGQWGGAVRGQRYIFSFSGFPELLCEAMMFALAVRLGQIKKAWVLERFGGRNEYLQPFFEQCHWTE